MKPFAFVKRRPVTTLMGVVALAGAVVVGLYMLRVDVPALRTAEIYGHLDDLATRVMRTKAQVFGAGKSDSGAELAHEEAQKVVVTSPVKKDVLITQEYVCQIHSQKHIDVCALEGGYLEKILVREGQAVKTGDLMFKILATLYQARFAAKSAEARSAELEWEYSQKLSKENVVSENEVALKQAKLLQAQAEATMAEAELNFTNVKAPFDGIVDNLHEQIGSLIKEGDVLTTLSDNRVMWVYFNVPEAKYLEYMAFQGKREEDEQIVLKLPGGSTFNQTGAIGAIEANFNNETGNIHFRADFPNPDRLLRHGQTGKVVIHHTLKDAIVIPQRAKFEILAKWYVYVVDEDHVVHQREIVVQNELDDVYVIQGGLDVGDKFILEGIRQVRDGDEVEYEFLAPEEALGHLKFHAE